MDENYTLYIRKGYMVHRMMIAGSMHLMIMLSLLVGSFNDKRKS